MSPETRAFLATVRHAEDPEPGDKRRIQAALGGSFAGEAESGAPELVAAKTGKLAGLTSASGLKIGGAVLALAAGTWLTSSTLARRSAAPHEAVKAPSAAVRAGVPTPVVSARSVPTSDAPANPAAPRTSETATRTKVPMAASLREEIALLADVQAALERGDGATALRRLDEHVTSDRQFVAERRAARILALCAAGRAAEARRAAAAFLRDHGGSVQRSAVERSCAGTKTNADR
jgi:hypothetical protein